MSSIPVATAELSGTFLEALGYGVYLAVFPQCLRILRRRNVGGTLMYYLWFTMLSTFAIVTAHLAIDLTRVFLAFTTHTSRANAAEEFYAVVNTKLTMTKNALYTVVTLLADALLIFRTYVVWGRNAWIVLVPTLVFIVDFAMAAWMNWSINQAEPGQSVLVSTVFARSKYFYAATLSLNVLCTGLIAFRIWAIQRSVAHAQAHRAGNNIFSIVLESAAIYTAYLIALISTASTGSSIMLVFLNSISSLVGSVFSYVIIRSSSSPDDSSILTHSSTGMTRGLSVSRGGFHTRRSFKTPKTPTFGQTTFTSYPPNDGVHVHLEQIVHADEGGGEPTTPSSSSYKKDSGIFAV